MTSANRDSQSAPSTLTIEHDAPISTWFKVGGIARQFARPTDVEQLRQCLQMDANLRILGDGANLLVDDGAVTELVVSVAGINHQSWDEKTQLLTVGAGTNLPKLVTQTVRDGLAGLEVLAGVPATIGGATVMNAGGVFGQIADVIERVFALDRQGRRHLLTRDEIGFSYRHSGLSDLIITGVDLHLTPSAPAPLRERLKEIMAYKKNSQPMAENSAGCAFKNPTLPHDLEGFGPMGQRVSAGKLIDRAQCKGLRIGSASVSPVHGNFLTADTGGRAHDVIMLMIEVSRRVFDTFGVKLEREVVVWPTQNQK